jgi:hypothetical protein
MSEDTAAIAAYGAWTGESLERVLSDWPQLPEPGRDDWRAVADAVRMTIEAQSPGALAKPAPPSDVHVDWHMTSGEWRQLYTDLWQHTDTPYIARLIEAGKIPAPPECLASHCPPSAHTDCEYPKCAPPQSAPEPAAAMAETRGQIAYETYAKAIPEDLFPASLRGMVWTGWEKLPDAEKRAYEAAAQAVIDAHNDDRDFPAERDLARITLRAERDGALGDLDQLRERVARTAAKLDADALATHPSKKSDIQRETAARLRETLGDQA